MKQNNTLLASRLKELRKSAGYTQDFVAASLGVVRQTYSHYENGIRVPSYDTLYVLSGLYHVTVDDLLHISVDIDTDTFFDAPSPTDSSRELQDYLDFINYQENQRFLKELSPLEKRMLFYLRKLRPRDIEELIQIARLKIKLNEPYK